MKKSIVGLLILVCSSAMAQNTIQKASFKVNGVCDLCKKTIEKSLQINSVQAAIWNPDSKVLKVKYDAALISLDSIQKRVAAVGYDTDKYKASEADYTNLHKCCKYERTK
jgi:copper chaperone CopZ